MSQSSEDEPVTTHEDWECDVTGTPHPPREIWGALVLVLVSGIASRSLLLLLAGGCGAIGLWLTMSKRSWSYGLWTAGCVIAAVASLGLADHFAATGSGVGAANGVQVAGESEAGTEDAAQTGDAGMSQRAELPPPSSHSDVPTRRRASGMDEQSSGTQRTPAVDSADGEVPLGADTGQQQLTPQQKLNIAREMKDRGEPRPARDYLVQIIEQDPTNAEAHYLLAWVAIDLNDRDLARAEFTAVGNLTSPGTNMHRQAKAALARMR